MTSETVPPRIVDQPVYFPPGDQTYFGLVSTPVDADRTTGVVLLSGTQTGSTTIGRNRMWVRVGRTLAARGFTALRVDYGGLGESLSGEPAYDLGRPAVAILREGIAHLQSLGLERFVIVGTCFGSRTALAGAAAEEDAEITGVLLLAPPVRNGTKGGGGAAHLAEYASVGDLARRALSVRVLRKLAMTKRARQVASTVLAGKARHMMGRGLRAIGGGLRGKADIEASSVEAAPGFVEPLRELVRRGIPARMIFGLDDMYWTEFERAREGRLGEILDGADTIDVHTVPGVIREFTSVRIQDLTIEGIVQWAEECSR